MANQEIEVKLAQTRQGIGVDIKSGGGLSKVIHDDTLQGDGTIADPLGIADAVMADIASKATETALQAETDARIQADEQLQDNIDTVAGNLETETQQRIQAINTLSGELATETTERQNAINTLTDALQAETTARTNADSVLSDKIDTVENDLTGDIDSLTTTVENNYTTLDTRITEVAESLQESIEDNVVALQQEDTALQNQINAHSQTLTGYDTRITNNANAITQETTNRQNADDTLQDQIDNLAARGRFLALWNATTGLPESNPGESPYAYKAGDYYIVGVVGETNYRPTGAQFVIGQPSTEIETEELATDDVYYYDGTVWKLQVNHGKTVSFANLAGQPDDNTALKQALDAKQPVGDYATNNAVVHLTGAETISGSKTFAGSAWNSVLQVKTMTTGGSFMNFENNNGQIASIGFAYNGIPLTLAKNNTSQNMLVRGAASGTAVGSSTIPVYINNNGIATACAQMQPKLTAGTNITINSNNVISASNAVNSVNSKTGTVVLSGADINATVSQQTKTVQGHLQTLSDSVQDIEKSKFIDATIMGTPTINNGQVSNFSSQSYLILPFAFDPKDRAFEINMAFTTGSNVTSNQNLLGGNYCIALLLEGGVLKFRASNNGTSWNVADITTSLTVQPNTNYFVRIAFNKLNYTILYSTNGEDYTQIGRLVSTLYPRHGQVFIGVGNNQFNPFLGIINLNKTNIKLNNSVIWQGMDDIGILTRADISLSNLDELGEAKFTAKQDVISDLAEIRSNASTGAGLAPQVEINTQRIEDLSAAKFPDVIIVGTPHIEGGQVSNYSDTSYLQFPFVDISRGQPFDIYFSFTTGADVTTQQNILDSYFGIALAIQNGKGIMALSSNGTSWNIGSVTGTNTLLPNTTYYVKYSWTGTAYSAALSTNDETYVPDMNLTSSLSPHKTTIFIGGSPNLFGPSTAHPFKGTINFNKSKVVVNNITVWEGMADVGLASRANVSLNNLDAVGQAKFDAKQDVITDLETIRSNASSAKSTVDTHVANGTIHVTANDKIAWSNKQNKLTAGTNITIDESTNTISATIGSDVYTKAEVDDKFVNKSDTEYIGHQAMPSDRYIDLTLGASGTSYTAPADGYFSIALDMYANGNVGLSNSSARLSNWQQTASTGYLDSFILAKKGDNIYIYYLNMNRVRFFRFVYAEGAQ